jgi:hypothetical protein
VLAKPLEPGGRPDLLAADKAERRLRCALMDRDLSNQVDKLPAIRVLTTVQSPCSLLKLAHRQREPAILSSGCVAPAAIKIDTS